MLLRIIYALGVCIVTIILCLIIGTLLVSAGVGFGNFIHNNAGLIGVLFAIIWFIWEPYTARRV